MKGFLIPQLWELQLYEGHAGTMLVKWGLIWRGRLPFKLSFTNTCKRTHTLARFTHTLTVIIQLRHVQVAQERRQRRESKAWLKWERMTAGATIWCRGLTAACPLDWLIGLIWQQGKKRSLKGPKYLLFSSSLSPHLNPSPSFPTRWFTYSLSISVSLNLALITVPHLPIKG